MQKVYVVQHHEDLAGEYADYHVYGAFAKHEDAQARMLREFENLEVNYENYTTDVSADKCTLTTEDDETISIDVTEYVVE